MLGGGLLALRATHNGNYTMTPTCKHTTGGVPLDSRPDIVELSGVDHPTARATSSVGECQSTLIANDPTVFHPLPVQPIANPREPTRVLATTCNKLHVAVATTTSTNVQTQ